ncbi:GNAT family N-acetyltransferase [Streptomyces sudanensis]|uniref:GNAT family N-acetyltransferase n=1 Tax=Streptomyces sudanensis TaxID=436397 RepID=UPI00029B2F80|nr:GNAT family N-acetyltransferase [Streptomyces sudanensis]MCP9988924.1 GNAT family N-acetyltransferase [Streptomyces sudanensis]
MTSITIDRAGADDIEIVTDLFLGYLDFYKAPASREAAGSFIAERLAKADSMIFIARDADGTALGFTQVYPTFASVSMGRVWILNDLYVVPDARRLGAGRALVRFVTDRARAEGVVRVTLATAEDNVSAQALYEAEGFTTGHPVRHYVKRTRQ